jgi:molybdate transport system substrate-binding protein
LSRRRRLAAVAIAFAVSGCATARPLSGSAGNGGPSATASPAASIGASVASTTSGLTIYGAASLKGALARIAIAYQAGHSGIGLTVSTDSSAALEAQIEQGAPADVFLSADTKTPQKLIAKGLATEAVPFARNLLTIIVPTTSGGGAGPIRSPVDLGRRGVKIIAAGDAVPITTYAHQLVANLAAQPGYPAGFATAYEANVVSREDNVGAIVTKVALGEGDAGIVYVTDARSSTRVAAVDVPPAANVVATYAGVVVTSSERADDARAFLSWLAGPDGQAILAEFGFLSPP